MASGNTFHIVPAPAGEWAIRSEEGSDPAGVFPTQGLAVAKAWELSKERSEVQVIVHGPDGAILSNLSIRRVEVDHSEEHEIFDPAEDEALRREAERITPRRAELDSLIDRLPPSSINYDDEDDELPC